MSRVVVIGAGIAGLSAARDLARMGHAPLVLEARGYPGGLIAGAPIPSAGTRADLITDIGAESFGTRGGAVAALAAELGLHSAPPEGRSWVLSTDGTAIRIPAGILGIPGLVADHEPDPDLAAALGGQDSPAYARALQDLELGPEVGQEAPDLASFVAARLGSAVVEALVRPVAGGIHSAPPESLALDVVAPGLRAATAEHGSLLRAVTALRHLPDPPPIVEQVVGGMHRLTSALARDIETAGGQVRTGVGVVALARTDAGYTVTTCPMRARGPELLEDGPRENLAADAVVVACSAPRALALLAPLAGVERWSMPEGSPIAHLTMVVRSADLDCAPRGSGMLVSPPQAGAEPFVAAKALTHMNAKWPWLGEALRAEIGDHYHLLRVSYGRHGEPYPEPTVAGAVRDVSRLTGVDLREDDVVASRLIRWDGTLAPPTPEHRRNVARLTEALRAHPGLAVTGAWVAGSGLAAVVPHARAVAREIASQNNAHARRATAPRPEEGGVGTQRSVVRLGTRASDLAVAQSTWVAEQLRRRGVEVQIVRITTSGDRSRRPLALMGGVGVFAATLRTALLEGECDLAVHSMKDLPVAPVPGLTIAAVPPREDPTDWLVLAPGLTELPDGASVGTGSPRRAAQLRAAYPGVTIADVRGNVPTRVTRAAEGDLDAVVLAASGLRRLGWREDGTVADGPLRHLLNERVVLPLPLLPAAAQGALAVECRVADASGDTLLARALADLNDEPSAAAAAAERAVLAELGAGCAAPVGTRATVTEDGAITLEAGVFAVDGAAAVRASGRAENVADADALGHRVARDLIAHGAGEIADIGATREARRADGLPSLPPLASGPLSGRVVLVPRGATDPITEAVRRAGAEAVAHPFLITHPLDADEDAIRDRLTSGTYTHVALTSARTVETLRARGLIDAIREAGCTVVSVGPATTGAATDAGLDVTHTGERDAESLATDLGPGANHHIWLPCSALAAPTLADRLQAAGWEVTREELYRVEPVPSVDVDLASAWQRGIIDAVLVTSGSVARAIAGLLGHAGPGTAVVTIGEPSARAVRTGGGIVAEVAQSPTPEGLLAACVRALGTQK